MQKFHREKIRQIIKNNEQKHSNTTFFKPAEEKNDSDREKKF